jgi:hypothetical protein
MKGRHHYFLMIKKFELCLGLGTGAGLTVVFIPRGMRVRVGC